MGVSGVVQIAKILEVNSTITSLNLFCNICDVDGARALGSALKQNKSLKFLDIGHNSLRNTGLKAIIQGIRSNSDSPLTQLGVCSNFINDDGMTNLFDELVLTGNGGKPQIESLFIKNNFLSDYNKGALYEKVKEAGLAGKLYVDVFESVCYSDKEVLDRSIWMSPMPKTSKDSPDTIAQQLSEYHECGFIVDVRVRTGKTVPKRLRENCYVFIEYAHENSIPRSLKLASAKKALFFGQPARVYKSGTRTAVIWPRSTRKR
jgi:hypothetical protein